MESEQRFLLDTDERRYSVPTLDGLHDGQPLTLGEAVFSPDTEIQQSGRSISAGGIIRETVDFDGEPAALERRARIVAVAPGSLARAIASIRGREPQAQVYATVITGRKVPGMGNYID
jgi:hypothetical protein